MALYGELYKRTLDLGLQMQVFHGPSSDAVTMHPSVGETPIYIARYNCTAQ